MLRVARSLELPAGFATQTCAILAQRRKGKTYTASVMAEEMVAVKQPFVALDPTGAWWGLRAGANGGKRGGLPVIVLGGEHGDVPLEDTAGKVVADLVVDTPGYYVLDLSGWESRGAEVRFARDFGERLYRRKGTSRAPLHLFVDEAELFVPQDKGADERRMLGAFESIVKRGGIRGLGTTLISQRAASVNKNVLEQIDILVVLRVVGPNDRDAIERYVKAYGTSEQRKALMDSLASLELGEAWFWEPGGEPPLFKRARVRKRRTFNSSATPKAGERREEPRELADVDLAALRDRMAATIEKQRAEDPKELQRQLAEARRELATKDAEIERARADRPEPERVEVPVLPREQLDHLEAAALDLTNRAEHAKATFGKAVEEMGEIVGRAEAASQSIVNELRKVTAAKQAPPPRPQPPPPRAAPERPAPERKAPERVSDDNGEVPTGLALEVLRTLAGFHPERLEKGQIATLVGKSAKGGYFNNTLSALRSSGYLVGTEITDAGLELIGPAAPPTAAEIRERWLQALSGLPGEMLRKLIEFYPRSLSKEELAVELDKEPRGGYFNNSLSRLRSNKLALTDRDRRLRASDDLFMGEVR